MDKIVITGGTGFIGLSLAQYLSNRGFQPVLVARNAPNPKPRFPFVPWDGHSIDSWCEALDDAKAVVNLAGKTVDCIKTPDNCDLILRSRVDSTHVLGEAFRQASNPPKVWVQMSTAHIYGDPPHQLCTESSSFGYGLAPFVGEAWEKTFVESLPNDVRGVRLRTSFVIGKNGGALKSLKRIVQLGLGGKVGNGSQGFSWIHEDDLNALSLRAITDETMEGVYIASAPNPVSNEAFMGSLRRTMKVPVGLPAPEWITRFGAKHIFKTDPELALYGRYVKSGRLEKEGFEFRFPELDKALEHLLN